MWKSLTGRAKKRLPSAPEGMQIYAVGDIHGRVDLLNKLFTQIDADAARNSNAKAVEIYLGDYIDRGPGSREVLDVPLGTSVMRAAIVNGVDGIVAECGGEMMCATCHVYVEPDQLERTPPQSDDEKAMLEFTASERKPNSRLSCQLVATTELDGLVVYLPETQV